MTPLRTVVLHRLEDMMATCHHLDIAEGVAGKSSYTQRAFRRLRKKYGVGGTSPGKPQHCVHDGSLCRQTLASSVLRCHHVHVQAFDQRGTFVEYLAACPFSCRTGKEGLKVCNIKPQTSFRCVFGPPLVMAEVLDKNRALECVVVCGPTLEESYRRATTQKPITERGLTQISRAGIPKRPLPNCQAGPTASSTPLFLNAQKPSGGHPKWAGPLTTSLRGLWVSGYLPRAMVERAKGRRP